MESINHNLLIFTHSTANLLTHCKMLSSLAHAALLLSLSSSVLGQAAPAAAKPAPDRFVSEIPQSEKIALAGIVEDAPDSGAAARKGGNGSPAYTLYSAPLAIPPQAQVKQ